MATYRETCACGSVVECGSQERDLIEGFALRHSECEPTDYLEECLLLRKQVANLRERARRTEEELRSLLDLLSRQMNSLMRVRTTLREILDKSKSY